MARDDSDVSDMYGYDSFSKGQECPKGAHEGKMGGTCRGGREGIIAIIDIASTGRESDGI